MERRLHLLLIMSDTLAQMFPIGRPATSSKSVTCTRCKGTGWWQFGRRCFKCGGVGRAERVTKETRLRDKRAHVAEVEGIIAENEARLAQLDEGAANWKTRGAREEIARRSDQLVQLRAELAVLEVA